ncbi:UbiD family decarboxylase domain-containing protein [Alistipes finegoldii]|uniref:UbiD family decarboxylase domain-containing protein n=1 Tax=Alistipes finegoldii TaxID=214856 RepID=UPI0039954AEA
MDEYLLAGFLRRRPVKLVKCVTNDIYVPADCDFVIEGYVDPAERKPSKAFGDHTGFYSLEDRYPLFPSRPSRGGGMRYTRPRSWGFLRRRTPVSRRQRSGYSGADTHGPAARNPRHDDARGRTAHNIAVVSIDSRYAGQAVKVAQSLWGAGQMMFNKYMLVVPAATDVRDSDALARLVRNLDPLRNIVAARGFSMSSTTRQQRRASAEKLHWMHGLRYRGRVRESAGACNACACRSPRGVEGVRPAADGAISGACAGQGDGGQPLLPAGYRSTLPKNGAWRSPSLPDAEVPVPPG